MYSHLQNFYQRKIFKFFFVFLFCYAGLLPGLVLSQTVDTLFFDDFEGSLANWQVSGQDWDTTNLAYVSHNHSITDSPVGNYPSYSNATITLANSIDLSSTNTPVLTFWHKYYVQANYDFCYVEISEDFGFTWSQLTSYTGYNTTLFHEQIDLSNYKTSPILIRFRLNDSGTTQYDGWYVDDVSIAELDTSLTSFPFFEDFESGYSNWLIGSQDWDTTSLAYVSPGHSITDSPVGNYPSYSNATFTLIHPIDLSSTNTPVLTFWHKYYVQANYDFCYVEISEDFGFSWSQLASYTGYNTTLFHEQIDLSNYKTSPILIRFRLRDSGNTQYDGWYVDDVAVAELDTSLTSFPFFEDFESGFDNWLVGSQDWDTTSVTYVSPVHSITDSPVGNYPSYSNATFTLAHPIDLSSTNIPILKFWHKYYVQENYDFCYIEISEDFGFTWTIDTSYTGYITTLIPEQINLSNYKTSPILIRFRLRDSGNTQYDGWHIDDVEIKDLNPNTVSNILNNIPNKYSLNQNYPNPFNPTTRIRFGLPNASKVNIEVYNSLGQSVAELVNEQKPAGYHSVQFDSDNLASGVYFYRIEAGTFTRVKKMLLVR